MIRNFPNYWDAPSQLLQLDGGCGLVTAWGILKYFRKRVVSASLIDSCRYTKKYGVFTIALAVALREHGLSVSYFSEADPEPNLIEQRCYRIAGEIGIQVEGAISLGSLLAQINRHSIPVVLYNTSQDSGHLTPLLGVEHGKVVLPYSDERLMVRREFLRRWGESEIFRQCVVAYR